MRNKKFESSKFLKIFKSAFFRQKYVRSHPKKVSIHLLLKPGRPKTK